MNQLERVARAIAFALDEDTDEWKMWTIEAQAAIDAMEEWQPIETAPKDGSEILIYSLSGDRYVVSYDDSFDVPWRIRNEEGLNENIPTHWMPLPEPPK